MPARWRNKIMKIVDGEVPKRNQAPAGIHHPVRLGGHPSCPGGEPYNWDFQGRLLIYRFHHSGWFTKN